MAVGHRPGELLKRSWADMSKDEKIAFMRSDRGKRQLAAKKAQGGEWKKTTLARAAARELQRQRERNDRVEAPRRTNTPGTFRGIDSVRPSYNPRPGTEPGTPQQLPKNPRRGEGKQTQVREGLYNTRPDAYNIRTGEYKRTKSLMKQRQAAALRKARMAASAPRGRV